MIAYIWRSFISPLLYFLAASSISLIVSSQPPAASLNLIFWYVLSMLLSSSYASCILRLLRLLSLGFVSSASCRSRWYACFILVAISSSLVGTLCLLEGLCGNTLFKWNHSLFLSFCHSTQFHLLHCFYRYIACLTRTYVFVQSFFFHLSLYVWRLHPHLIDGNLILIFFVNGKTLLSIICSSCSCVVDPAICFSIYDQAGNYAYEAYKCFVPLPYLYTGCSILAFFC